MDRGSEKTLFQRRHTNGQQVRGRVPRVPNITAYEGNTGQNHSEIMPHTSRIAVLKKTEDEKRWWARMWRERSHFILLVEI